MFLSVTTAAVAVLLGALAPTVSADCQWAHLQDGTDAYLESQQSGKPYDMFLAKGVIYRENNRETNISRGIFGRPLKIDHSRRLIDQAGCSSYTEIISADPKDPWVIGTQLHFNGSMSKIQLRLIDTIATTTGDWLFNASRSLQLVNHENWTSIAQPDQDSRAKLKAAADAYLDLWANHTRQATSNHNTTTSNSKNATAAAADDAFSRVPWGRPCRRMEGSAYTGKGLANDTCSDGIPTEDQLPVTERRYVIDETVGAVNVLCRFQTMRNAPDSHEFRLEKGKLRYVHTMTVMRNATRKPTIPRMLL